MSASRENFPMGDEVESLNVGIENISNDANSSHNSLRSYFARLNYNYADKYLFEANIRNDGSSGLHPNNAGGYFLLSLWDGALMKSGLCHLYLLF